jgi:hypothetical protein
MQIIKRSIREYYVEYDNISIHIYAKKLPEDENFLSFLEGVIYSLLNLDLNRDDLYNKIQNIVESIAEDHDGIIYGIKIREEEQ